MEAKGGGVLAHNPDSQPLVAMPNDGRVGRRIIWIKAIFALLVCMILVCLRMSTELSSPPCKVKNVDLPNGLATCEDGTVIKMSNVQLSQQQRSDGGKSSGFDVVKLEHAEEITVDELVYSSRIFLVQPTTGQIYSEAGNFIGYWINGVPYGTQPGMQALSDL